MAETMRVYTGVCVGGPEHGKSIAYMKKSIPYVSPLEAKSSALVQDRDKPVEFILPLKVGTYEYVAGFWSWHSVEVAINKDSY